MSNGTCKAYTRLSNGMIVRVRKAKSSRPRPLRKAAELRAAPTSSRHVAADFLRPYSRTLADRMQSPTSALGIIAGPIASSAWSGLTLPGDVVFGKASKADVRRRATDIAGLLSGGGVMGRVGGATKLAQNSQKSYNRNNLAGFNAPTVAQRKFDDDYRKTPDGAEGSRLAFDMEGRALDARFVAGRRKVGGGDEDLGPDDVSNARREFARIKRVKSSDLPGRAVGSYVPRQNLIKIRDDLDPADTARVAAHEFGHIIDQFAGGIPTTGMTKELRKVYHDLSSGMTSKMRPKDLMGPEAYGYHKSAVDSELMAESVRAYMTNPN